MREGIYQGRVLNFSVNNGAVVCVLPSLFGDQPQTCSPAVARPGDIARIAPVSLNDIVWVFSAGNDDSPLQWFPNVRDVAFDSFYADGSNNILDNGEFIICQRENQVTSGFFGLPNGQTMFTSSRGADRWNATNNTGIGAVGVYPSYAIATAGDPGISAMFIQNGATAGAMGSTAYFYFRQLITGDRMMGLLFGRPEAKPFTVSFWVTASVPGTYAVEMEHAFVARRCTQLYSITASEVNVWVYKTVTFPPDTSVAIPNSFAGNYQGPATALNFWQAAGSAYNSGNSVDAYTSWTASGGNGRAAGQTNMMATASQNFGITKIKMQPGSVATPYEHLPFEAELARAQRWCHRVGISGQDGFSVLMFGSQASTTGLICSTALPQPMVKVPVLYYGGSIRVTDEVSGTVITSMTMAGLHSSRQVAEVAVSYAAFGAVHIPLWVTGNGDVAAFVTFDADN